MIWPAPIRVAGISFHLKDVSRVASDEVRLVREEVEGDRAHGRAIAIYGWVTGPLGPILEKFGYVPRGLADMVPDAALPATGRIVRRSEPPVCALEVQA